MSVLPLSRVGEREEVANFARHVPYLALRPPDQRAKGRSKWGMNPCNGDKLNNVVIAAAARRLPPAAPTTASPG